MINYSLARKNVKQINILHSYAKCATRWNADRALPQFLKTGNVIKEMANSVTVTNMHTYYRVRNALNSKLTARSSRPAQMMHIRKNK